MTWYLKASATGNAQATCTIGDLHRNGQGVPASDAVANQWYQKAADMGDESACFSLAAVINMPEA